MNLCVCVLWWWGVAYNPIPDSNIKKPSSSIKDNGLIGFVELRDGLAASLGITQGATPQSSRRRLFSAFLKHTLKGEAWEFVICLETLQPCMLMAAKKRILELQGQHRKRLLIYFGTFIRQRLEVLNCTFEKEPFETIYHQSGTKLTLYISNSSVSPTHFNWVQSMKKMQ